MDILIASFCNNIFYIVYTPGMILTLKNKASRLSAGR